MLRSIGTLTLAAVTTLPCWTQSNPSSSDTKPSAQETVASALKSFYRLAFVVQELENDRIINSRSYLMIVRDTGRSSIRAGEKVPFSATSGPGTQWQQIDVGVNIDCRKLEVMDNKVSLDIKAEISSVVETNK